MYTQSKHALAAEGRQQRRVHVDNALAVATHDCRWHESQIAGQHDQIDISAFQQGQLLARNVVDGAAGDLHDGDDWAFDPLLTLEQYQDTTGTIRATAVAVDRDGRVTQYADELNTITFTEYDQAARPVKTSRAFSGSAATTLTETTYFTAATTADYPKVGRVKSVKEYASGTARTTTFDYDSYGRPASSTLPNGIATVRGAECGNLFSRQSKTSSQRSRGGTGGSALLEYGF